MFGFIPNNIELYKLALIHKSASQSIGGHHINNERLEFLGDAVIESVTSDYLYIEFPDKSEGFMTQLRAKIVSRQSLNDIAHKIGLDKYVVYNSGGSFTQKHIYGDAFEAMIGAIYLDQGYDFVNRLLINNIYYNHLSLDALTESETDFKSRLIEWCQKNRHSVVFRTRSDAHAPRTAPTFYSTVLIDGIEVGHGVGDSKKVAEQNAAGSLSHEMSDEECAELLDKFDKFSPAPMVQKAEPGIAEESASAKPKRARRPKKSVVAAEQGEVAVAESAAEIEAAEKPKRRRRPTKPKSVAEEIVPVANAEAPEKAEKSAKPAKTEKAEKAEKTAKQAKPEKTEKAKKTKETEKAESVVKSEKSVNAEKSEKSKTSAQPKKQTRRAKSAKAVKGEVSEHAVKVEKEEKTESEIKSA
ncbi:MAG: ribonuclease III [Rikenellaceae bacterium]|nr:ribonuclease III [Rikenellaceae bacterium]